MDVDEGSDEGSGTHTWNVDVDEGSDEGSAART